MNLDDRLREIVLSDLFMDGLPANIHQEPLTKAHYDWAVKMVAQIKEAFKAEGYAKQPIVRLSRKQSFEETQDPIYLSPTLMTGQEWYDRFTDIIDNDRKLFSLPDDVPVHELPRIVATKIRIAAKRASNLGGE